MFIPLQPLPPTLPRSRISNKPSFIAHFPDLGWPGHYTVPGPSLSDSSGLLCSNHWFIYRKSTPNEKCSNQRVFLNCSRIFMLIQNPTSFVIYLNLLIIHQFIHEGGVPLPGRQQPGPARPLPPPPRHRHRRFPRVPHRHRPRPGQAALGFRTPKVLLRCEGLARFWFISCIFDKIWFKRYTVFNFIICIFLFILSSFSTIHVQDPSSKSMCVFLSRIQILYTISYHKNNVLFAFSF